MPLTISPNRIGFDPAPAPGEKSTFRLPFLEQIAYFQGKKLVPTDRWNDLVREQHDAGFMVAKAIKGDLLADLHGAVNKAIEKGTTLAEFRKDFESIVAKHGWTGWRGEKTEAGRAWRARLIYETNLRTSYQAGRWAQVQATKATRPYLIYKHSDAVITPRPLHKSWDGLVVRIDDPWVRTHWPPNGWGCQCTMFSVSERDLKKMGKSGPDTPPDDGTYEWTDKKTGEVHRFPNGIDPFWDYTPGASRMTTLGSEIERKLEAWPKSIADAVKKDLAIPIPPPSMTEKPRPQAFTTNKKLDIEKILDDVLTQAGAQGELVRQAIDRHGIKSLFLSATESTFGSQASRKISAEVNDFLKIGADPSRALDASRFAWSTRGRCNGFTRDGWRVVVVRSKNEKTLQANGQLLKDGVAAAIDARINNNGPWTDSSRNPSGRSEDILELNRHWSFSAAADEKVSKIVTWAHEIGHQIHFAAGKQKAPKPWNITKYSETNNNERHAEHFVAWLFNRNALVAYDKEIAEYFDELVSKAATPLPDHLVPKN